MKYIWRQGKIYTNCTDGAKQLWNLDGDWTGRGLQSERGRLALVIEATTMTKKGPATQYLRISIKVPDLGIPTIFDLGGITNNHI